MKDMIKRLWLCPLVFLVCIFFVSCGFSHAASSSQSISNPPSSDAASLSASSLQPEETQVALDLADATLTSYLKDCWGYTESAHDLFFDTIIELNDVKLYSFKVYSVKGEYSNTFAISVEEEKVYLFDEPTDKWVEDKNPEPWSGW